MACPLKTTDPRGSVVNEIIDLRVDLERPDFHLGCDLSLPSSGITVLFGSSGSGKTTLLRCVAGLETTFKGRIAIGEHVWFDDAKAINLPVWRRPIGYVFQEASLFDHLSVKQNLHFGLKRIKDKSLATQDLSDAVELLGIGALLDRYPNALSGGERQRVAIARALATRPTLLLLDEPMAALDHKRKQEIMPWLERLRDELKITMLYVTHSLQESARLGNHMVRLENGAVLQSGLLNQVMGQPNDPAVPTITAIIEAKVSEIDSNWHLARVGFGEGQLWMDASHLALDQAVRLQVAARDVSLTTTEPSQTSIQNVLPARIIAIQDGVEPSQAVISLDYHHTTLFALVTHKSVDTLALAPGKMVWAQVKSVALLS